MNTEEDQLAKNQADVAMDVNSEEEILDFSNVRPFEPLDSGVRYHLRLDELKIGRSKATGEKKSSAVFTILAPEEVSVEEWVQDDEAEGGMKFVGMSDRTTKASGRKLFREFSHQSQALPFLYQLLKALDPSVELNEAFRYNPSDYIGLECDGKIQNEAFQEQIRPRLKTVYATSASA